MTVFKRFIDFCKYNKIKQSDFVNSGKWTKQTISNLFNERTSLSIDHVSYLKEISPNLSTEWLITGNGDMSNTGSSAGNCKECIAKDKRIGELEERIQEYKDFNRGYQDMVVMYKQKLAFYEDNQGELSKAASED